MKGESSSLYLRVVHITNIYLGPAAERFIDRQIQNHINKDPEKLSVKDLEGLLDWIRIAVSLLTDDREIVQEYILQLERLVRPTDKAQSGQAT